MFSAAIKSGKAAAAGAAEDPYFYTVPLLLSGDGTNGAQNNTFVDGSTNNFTITRNGNTTQGSFSPYASTGGSWSNYFDSATNNSYFTAPSGTAWAFGTGDFTVEAWVYMTAFANYRAIVGNLQANDSTWMLAVSSSGVVTFQGYNTVNMTSSSSLTLNSWNHVVAVRSGTDGAIFINGTRVATASSYSTNISTSATLYIGRENPDNVNFAGYISNLRIIKGTAQYSPTSTTLTVPTTPLTAVSGTQLLACQSNRFIDNSTNAFALTAAGAPSVQRFSPFNPTAPYSTSVVGGSGYFDGSGDYLNLTTNAGLGLGTGTYTVECWVYASSAPGYSSFLQIDTSGLQFGLDPSGYIAIAQQNVAFLVSSSTTLPLNTWNHVAASRDGSNVTRIFLNGVQIASATNTTNFATGTTAYINHNSGNSAKVTGYITDVRVLKGTALYTSAFTPPTAPLTAITNTSLLLNYTNGGIYDSAMMNDLETVGNAQISTSVKKYGTGSLAFDGTGDYLVSNANPSLYTFGTGDFTIEMWAYFSNVSTLGVFYDSRPNLTNGAYPAFYVLSGVLYFYANSSNLGSASVSTGQWYHVAVSRSSGTSKLFLNGTQSSSWTDSIDYSNGSARPYIGGSGFGAGAGDAFNGYIDDLRITKGLARYIANFTAPTTALPNY